MMIQGLFLCCQLALVSSFSGSTLGIRSTNGFVLKASVEQSTAAKISAEKKQRSLLTARLEMESKRSIIKAGEMAAQAAEMESSPSEDAPENTLAAAQTAYEQRIAKQSEARKIVSSAKKKESAAAQSASRTEKQAAAAGIVKEAKMKQSAAAQSAARAEKQAAATKIVKEVKMKESAAAQFAARTEKQAAAAGIVTDARRKQSAGAEYESRISKQTQAAHMVADARRKASAEANQKARAEKQALAAKIRADNMTASSSSNQDTESTVMPGEMDETTVFEAGAELAVAHCQRRSFGPGELDDRTSFYASIEDVGERAYQILKDLDFFKIENV